VLPRCFPGQPTRRLVNEKKLILLVPGEGLEPQTNGLQIRHWPFARPLLLTRFFR
jgi:hypothetical protein